MKKYIFILSAFCLLLLSSNAIDAQTVNYSVSFGWDDQACECNEPLTMEGRVILLEYPSMNPVDDSGWFTMTTNPWTYYGSVDGLRDCVDEHPCYTVYVYVRYKDNTGVCCSGSSSANTTGQLLQGIFSFPNTIILN
jgi:hypothetical protein